MAERLVAFSHPMSLFLSLHRATGVLGSVEDLERELLGHALAAALAGKAHDPPPGERQPPVGTDLDRNLVGGAAHAPRLDLEQGRRVAHGALEHLERLLLGLLGSAGQGVVDDLLGGRPLGLCHHHVDELGDRLRLAYRVGRIDTLDWAVTARHQAAAFVFSRLAPYLERAFLRFLVPAVSRVPRMMW